MPLNQEPNDRQRRLVWRCQVLDLAWDPGSEPTSCDTYGDQKGTPDPHAECGYREEQP